MAVATTQSSGYSQLVQPNKHPETARASGQKPANRVLATHVGGGSYILASGRPKP